MTKHTLNIVLRALSPLLLVVVMAAPARAEVVPKVEGGLFDLYALNRKDGVGNYVTEDLLLLSYGMLLNQTLTQLEEKDLYPALLNLVKGLMQSQQSNTDDPSKANSLYLKLLECLLTGDEPFASPDGDRVATELKLIREAKGLAQSPLMAHQIDYSQFLVRGKYAQSPTLSRYFQAMMYAGLAFFPLKESKATGVDAARADLATAQALALAKAIRADKTLDATYRKLQESLAWIVGPSEDLRPEDYLDLAAKTPDQPALRNAVYASVKDQKRLPTIISTAIDKNALEPGLTAADVVVGFRLLPQRATQESAAFQLLVWDQVRDFQGKDAPFTSAMIDGKLVKGYPMGIELMALLGAANASEILKKSGDTNYKDYDAAAAKAKGLLDKKDTLPGRHLDLLRFWLTQGEPSKDDATRRLNTSLGFWTYQRYVNTLYAKQSYTSAGKGISLSPERASAWLEPAAELYEQVRALVKELRRNIADERLDAFEKMLERCVMIARHEQSKKPLPAKDVAFLNNLDRELLEILGGPDKPIIVDAHTEPTGGKVLEEGLGFARPVEKEVEKAKVRGGLMSYYEFKQPMDKRLSVKEWEELLRDAKALGERSFSPGTLFLKQTTPSSSH